MGNFRVVLVEGWGANSGDNNLQDLIAAKFTGTDPIIPSSIVGGIKVFSSDVRSPTFGAIILHNINGATALATPDDSTFTAIVKSCDGSLSDFETLINAELMGIDDGDLCSFEFNGVDTQEPSCIIGYNVPA